MQTTYEEWLEEGIPFTGPIPISRAEYYKRHFPNQDPRKDYDFIAANCDYNAGRH